MKNMLTVLILLAVFFLSGCAGTTVNPDYSAYLAAKESAIYKAKPTLVIECPDEGCQFKKIEYYDSRDRVVIAQKAPHPGYALAGKALRYGVYGFLGYQAFDFLGSAIDAAGNNYSHSFNEIDGDNIHTGHLGDGNQIGDTQNIIDSYNNTDNSVTHPDPEAPEPEPEGKGWPWM